MIVAYFKLAQR